MAISSPSGDELDDGPLRAQPHAGRAGIFEAGAMAAESRSKPRGFSALQPLRHLEAVDHDRVAALDRVLQAGENLQRRHRVAIGIVGVRLQAEIGVGEVVRIDLGAHLEPAAVIRLAHIAEELGDLAEAAGLARHVGQHGEAVAAHCGEPAAERLPVGGDCRIASRRARSACRPASQSSMSSAVQPASRGVRAIVAARSSQSRRERRRPCPRARR